MELITFSKELLQSAAEYAASYKVGQTVLRHLDRALWVVEKAARWAVPPPLDQDDRPQPELVRPLPWPLFLILLVLLRVTRESVSLVNLVMGKPPLRSADVVMYIQGKRRHLRTLKYQGARLMRARGSAPTQPWFSGARTLLQFTMCFRRHNNNNSSRVNDNEQVMVVKRKRSRETGNTAATTTENTMERLLEKMMVDLNADSEDDSSYTLTNATSIKSDSDVESDQDTVFSNDVSISTPNRHAISTPQKPEGKPQENTETEPIPNYLDQDTESSPEDMRNDKKPILNSKAKSENSLVPSSNDKEDGANPNATFNVSDKPTPKEETQNFLQAEITAKGPKSPKKKIGRTITEFFRPKPKVVIKSSEVANTLVLSKINRIFRRKVQ